MATSSIAIVKSLKRFNGTLLFNILALSFTGIKAQISYNANTRIDAYTGSFAYGSNMGSYSPWDDYTLANIAAGNTAINVKGAGVKSLHAPLPEYFLEQWGYSIRQNQFNHYASLGIIDNTVFIGYPSAAHKETSSYCTNTTSALFKNLYTDIWDGGVNGTPVNDNNYYALYLYKMLKVYKYNVKFWEIWNEPDYTYSGNGNKAAGVAGNWWDSNPPPCDLENVKAPIYHYVRMLRISYEVIKTLDPRAYVAVGGLGYPSFLDAVLRNTDNPTDGSVNSSHPFKGGAYFDAVSFHSYPQHSLKTWSNTINGFVYRRHSDAAAEEVFVLKNRFETTLTTRGYDGTTFPKKLFIVSECNIGRKEFGDFIGSDDAQKNFIIKTLVKAQKNDVRQFYIYTLGDGETLAAATSSYQTMGLYQKLSGVTPYNQVINNEGIAYKTTSNLLFGYTYDPARTQALALPAAIDGGAFKNRRGAYIYVLWAKTTIDKSEVAAATYTFPAAMNVTLMKKKQWDYSNTLQTSNISGNSLALTAATVFLTTNSPVAKNTIESEPSSDDVSKQITIIPNPASEAGAKVMFAIAQDEKVTLSLMICTGQLSRIILNDELLQKGEHTIDLNTQGLASGIYFIQLLSQSTQQAGKLMISQ